MVLNELYYAGLLKSFCKAHISRHPHASIKYILYDEQEQPIQADFVPVTEQALDGWQELSLSLPIEQDGYLQVMVDNESELPVWFDDVEISHQEALIVQENHYDPFGLNLVGIGKVGNNSYQYNSQSEKQADPTGSGYFYETPLRQYDPQLGRFNGVDVLADEYVSLTPYQYGGNNPILFSDPTGAMPRAIADGYELWFKSGGWGLAATNNYRIGRQDMNWATGLASSQAGTFSGYGVGSSHYSGSQGSYDYYLMRDALQSLAQSWGGTYCNGSIIVNQSVHVPSVPQLGTTYSSYAIQIGYQDPSTLDPSTGPNKNLFGDTYTGSHNPLSYDGSYNYSLRPANMSDAVSKAHDLRYDSKGAKAGIDLYLNTRILDADATFVSDQFNIVGAFISQSAFFATKGGIGSVTFDPYTGEILSHSTAARAFGAGSFIFAASFLKHAAVEIRDAPLIITKTF